MFQPTLSQIQSQPPYAALADSVAVRGRYSDVAATRGWSGIFGGVRRRITREVRRRKVGRAYDMALEIARVVPQADEILDVGCGNGFVSHHLAGMLGSYVLGIDVAGSPEAPINFRQYDGVNFPAPDDSFEVALFCYVLHHAQDVYAILDELRRVLRDDGVAIIYEDTPYSWWDRIVCAIHNLKWQKRTGPCTFHNEAEWREIFGRAGFEMIRARKLSRWRKIVHPVRREFYVLRVSAPEKLS